MRYQDMCAEIRVLMAEEVEIDGPALYISAYFTNAGAAAWKTILLQACDSGDDVTLAKAIDPTFLKSHHTYLRMGKPVTARVPPTAAKAIAESNFSRFYLRALCRLAEIRGVSSLVGYRAMQVMQPRAGSEAKIGALFPAQQTLADLRATMSGEPQFGMPPGVGSGILARLP